MIYGAPSPLAYAILFSWPLIAYYLFTKLPFERAIIWSVVGSFLFLPNLIGIDLPAIPPLNKVSLPSLVLLALVLLKAPTKFRVLPSHIVGKALLVLLLLGTMGSALTNQDPLYIGGGVTLQGTALYDAASDSIRIILVIVPLLVGWQYLAKVQAQEDVLRVLVTVGTFYALLTLVEVRLSPQIHGWVYGYHTFGFGQQMRADGFRPVVFLPHGLWTAFFIMTIMVAAAALWRLGGYQTGGGQKTTSGKAAHTRYLHLTGFFGIVLVLCKSLGSLIFGILLVPLVLLTKPRTQVTIAAILAAIAIMYPLLRGGGVIPVDSILETATSYSAERGQSLETRLVNEEIMLAHANERPLFGWGGWGRWRIYDPETAEDVTISDGLWIIIIGSSGWAGYIAQFGLLGFPILAVWWRQRRMRDDSSLSPATSALCLLLAINMIEILPNSTLPPWTWLIAGALMGYAKLPAEERTAEKPVETSSLVKQRRTIL